MHIVCEGNQPRQNQKYTVTFNVLSVDRMRNKTMIAFLFCFSIKTLYSQVIRHRTVPVNPCGICNPGQDWNDISNKRLLKLSPFNRILHLSFKRKDDINRYGTACFISKDLLITARHCVDQEKSLEYLELNLPSLTNNWVRLNKKDYKIYYYTELFNKREYDIALIKVINKQKLSILYHGHFNIVDSPKIIISNCDVSVSGFPSNKFAINSAAPDTLVNRKLSAELIEFNSSNNMIGYPTCTCNGDSGAPIWVKNGNEYFIVGVHCGPASKEEGFVNLNLNVGVFLGSEVSKWIKSVKNSPI